MPVVFKNRSGYRIDIPLLDLHIDDGETFQVPEELADQFDVNPLFESTKRKTADVTVDPAVVEAVVTPFTGPIPVPAPEPSPAA